jgi:predicted ABC-type ATPase
MTDTSSPKKIIIIAGPNGAGKTTFAKKFLPEFVHCTQFINADLIASGLSPFAPEKAAVKAGRLMLEAIEEAVLKGESFAIETTLSGRIYLRHIQAWKSLGYHVSLFFLSLPHETFAICRVAERVKQGGHNIPEAVIKRRFASGKRNFEQYYKEVVDVWALYDMSDVMPVMLEWGENNASE